MLLYKFPQRPHAFETLRALLRVTIREDCPQAMYQYIDDLAVWHDFIYMANAKVITSKPLLIASVRIYKRHIQVQILEDLKITAAVVAAWHRRRFDPNAFQLNQEQSTCHEPTTQTHN